VSKTRCTIRYGAAPNLPRWVAMVLAATGAAALPQLFLM
jgi:hypothetical protein